MTPSPFKSLVLLVWNQSVFMRDQSKELILLSLFKSPEMSFWVKVKVLLLERVKVCLRDKVVGPFILTS